MIVVAGDVVHHLTGFLLKSTSPLLLFLLTVSYRAYFLLQTTCKKRLNVDRKVDVLDMLDQSHHVHTIIRGFVIATDPYQLYQIRWPRLILKSDESGHGLS